MSNPDKLNPVTDVESEESRWKGLYKVAGVAAIIAVIVGLIESIIMFLPGGSTSPETVTGWFTLLQNNWFLGLRNLGFMNIIFIPLGIPTFLALYAAHRRTNKAYVALIAMIISLVSITVFLATNRAFPMLELSSQYASAMTDVQKSMLTAAGQSMLSVGESHVPGTFIGFSLGEIAGITISVVMLWGKVFSKTNAFVGIFGFTFLLVNEIFSSFVPGLFNTAMIFGMGGGLLSMIWYIMISRRFFQLGHIEKN